MKLQIFKGHTSTVLRSRLFQTIWLLSVSSVSSVIVFEVELDSTAEGVNVASVLKMVPILLSHRISATKPAPTSNILPEASGPSG